MNVTTVNLETDIGPLIGLDALSEDERVELLSQLGNSVMYSSLLALTSRLSEEQAASLEHYLETEPDSTTMLQHLIDTYPMFGEIFESETLKLKQDIVSVLGEPSAA